MRTPPINRRIFRSEKIAPASPLAGPRTDKDETIGARARDLRANATDAERILWTSLRVLRAQGIHFRRQVPFPPYIADFSCKKAGLIVELDGGQHSEPDALAYDAARTQFLEKQGYRVMRFGNDEVFRNRDGVVDAIWQVLLTSPPDPRFARIDLPGTGR